MNKHLLKDLIPPVFLRMVTGLFYGWHGNYSSWSEAAKKCDGYNSPDILNKVKDSALKVKNGQAAYERDSLLIDHIEYSFPLLSGLLWIAGQNNGNLNVLDFGGSLGSSYFQNKLFLDNLNEVNWCIVEQQQFVRTGNESFADDRLHFFSSLDEALNAHKIHAVLLSSVLQYLEEPYNLLKKIIAAKPEYIIIDRTPFVKGHDRITIQKVNPAIYEGSYPCWFFNMQKFISFLMPAYEMVFAFDALDRANIPSEFKGFLFRRANPENQRGS